MPFAYTRRQYIGHRMTIQEKTINKPVFIALAKTGDRCNWLPGDQCGRSATILSPTITPLTPSDSELLQNGPLINSLRSPQNLLNELSTRTRVTPYICGEQRT